MRAHEVRRVLTVLYAPILGYRKLWRSDPGFTILITVLMAAYGVIAFVAMSKP